MKAQIVAVVCYQHPLFGQSKLQSYTVLRIYSP